MEKWFLYVVECADGSLYAGITNDVEARITKHNNGTGAKYTRGRGPVVLKKTWEFETKSAAAMEEYSFKKLKKMEKLKRLVSANKDITTSGLKNKI